EEEFQNEVGPKEVSENGIVNGASFNYANENDYKSGKPEDPNSVHGRLDVRVGDVDPKWRTDIINNNGDKYKTTSTDQYKNSKDEKYFSNGKSIKEISDEIKDALKKQI